MLALLVLGTITSTSTSMSTGGDRGVSDPMGAILQEYEARLRALREVMLREPSLDEVLFEGFDAWERLLTFKLAPRLAGEGCLIVAVAGGTNTGKSTVFNSLLGRAISPVSPYGAYTRRTLVAANAFRKSQCLEPGKLLPDPFIPRPWNGVDRSDVNSETTPAMTVFVALHDALPDRMVVLDTPDIDSVVTTNWELAKTIREAGDILVAVLTAQKYADKCVVDFFRQALRDGRLVVPVINLMEDTAQGREVARRQVADFVEHVLTDTGDSLDAAARQAVRDGPVFVLSRSTSTKSGVLPCPAALDDERATLMSYLTSVDAVAIKNKILADSLKHFAERGAVFLERAAGVHAAVRRCIRRIEEMAHAAAARYEPRPGREVVTVVYDFIQQHGRWPDRMLGAVTAQVLKIPGRLIKGVRGVFGKESGKLYSEAQFGAEHRRKIEEIVHALYGDGLSAAKALRAQSPEAAKVIEEGLTRLDPTSVATAIAEETLNTAAYIGPYRTYAFQELESRWGNRAFRWKVRIFYDLGLLGSWAGVLVLLWVKGWAPGLPLSEILASFSVPVAQHAVTHGAMYLWGDKLAGLIDRWQSVQRAALEQAILTRLAYPALGTLRDVNAAFEEHLNRIKELNGQCQECSSARS